MPTSGMVEIQLNYVKCCVTEFLNQGTVCCVRLINACYKKNMGADKFMAFSIEYAYHLINMKITGEFGTKNSLLLYTSALSTLNF